VQAVERCEVIEVKVEDVDDLVANCCGGFVDNHFGDRSCALHPSH
jgi:hypothetical protein